MKIYNKIVIEWNDETQSYDKVVYEDSYEYDGELMLAGWGCPHADIDGVDHGWVVIGDPEVEGYTQCWTAENLKTTVYSDGTAIEDGAVASNWVNFGAAQTGAYAQIPEIDWEGYHYNWYAVTDSRGICPVDVYSLESQWHIPTHDEWTELERYVCTKWTANSASSCVYVFPLDTTTSGW